MVGLGTSESSTIQFNIYLFEPNLGAEMPKLTSVFFEDTFYEKETSKLLKGLEEDCRGKPQALGQQTLKS